MLKPWLWLLVLCPLWSQADNLLEDAPKNVIFATTHWCPYACEDLAESPGVVYEFVKALLNKQGIEVQIQFYPWTRAIKEVTSGRAHGLLTAVHEEAPHLNFTNTPTMSYRVCFFTDGGSGWSYSGVDSLKGITLGAIRGYGYDPQVNQYIRRADVRSSLQLISGGDEITRFIEMLSLGRIDVFLDDQYVTAWQVKSNGIDFTRIRKAGCLADTPFYMGFNPALEWGDNVIEFLDESLKLKASQETLQSILKKYTVQK
ncbi:MAG: hypothetical protein CL679_00880 [Bermanella sp.]|nr:hypothetical protein [Bermanella sp.]